jgi:hypothetical protein
VTSAQNGGKKRRVKFGKWVMLKKFYIKDRQGKYIILPNNKAILKHNADEA